MRTPPKNFASGLLLIATITLGIIGAVVYALYRLAQWIMS